MATPNYKGAGQPSANGGSWLSALVGGTPVYQSVAKGTNASKDSSSGAALQPALDSVATDLVEQSDACGPGRIAIVIPREVIEQ